MGFARFLISHIHLRFYRIYMKNKLFTRSLIACASGSAAGTRNNEREAGSVATVLRRLFSRLVALRSQLSPWSLFEK